MYGTSRHAARIAARCLLLLRRKRYREARRRIHASPCAKHSVSVGGAGPWTEMPPASTGWTDCRTTRRRPVCCTSRFLPEQHFHGHGPCVLVAIRVNPFQHQAPFVAVSSPRHAFDQKRRTKPDFLTVSVRSGLQLVQSGASAFLHQKKPSGMGQASSRFRASSTTARTVSRNAAGADR